MDYQRLKVTGPNGEPIKTQVPNRGANPYVDDYVGFTWNNIHSSNYNCFIENTGHLEFVGAPDFSNNFVSPAFQTRTYYTGMQNQSKKFNLNLVFYQLTLSELNAALHWLDRTLVSDFYFDYEPYWKYSCKLASIGVMEKYVVGRTMYRGRPCDTYLCRVPVQFETVYHPEAISAYEVCKYTDSTNEFTKDYSDNSGAQYLPYSEYEDGQWGPLIQLVTRDDAVPTPGYWRFILKNPSAHPTYFKLHFYNVHSGVTVYEYWNNDYFNSGLGDGTTDASMPEGDIDAYENSTCICNVTLSLDPDIMLDLHYNSEDGTVLCANQLIEQLRSANAMVPCIYKVSSANIYIPGAFDSDHPSSIALEIEIPAIDDMAQPNVMIEYDTYEYMI